jgi:hypothetical protein
MGIGNHELVEHENNNAERLTEEFISEHTDEWEEFWKFHKDMYEQELREDFCVEHQEWGQFVLDDYTNSNTE